MKKQLLEKTDWKWEERMEYLLLEYFNSSIGDEYNYKVVTRGFRVFADKWRLGVY